MSQTLQSLLYRATRIRALQERERRLPSPDRLRLMRLNGLALRLRARLCDMAREIEATLSGPTLRPVRANRPMRWH